MATIESNLPPTNEDVELFIGKVNFRLPQGFMEFYKETNGAYINGEKKNIVLWPLTDLMQFNTDYKVDIYAPGFFIFGSDGGGMAYAIEKDTGFIFEMPFIGMSKEEALFISEIFDGFIETL